MKPHAEIAGGGFAGLAAGVALCQRGWTVRLHERAPQVRSFGAGIGLWQCGMRVLDAIGALDAVVEHCHKAPSYDDRDENNQLIFSRPLPLPGGVNFFAITRQNLHSCLLDAAIKAGVEICTNSEAVFTDPAGELTTADGHRHKADLVIGADGVGSRIRDCMHLRMQTGKYHIGITRVLVAFNEGEYARPEHKPIVNHWAADRERRVIFCPCDADNLYLALAANVGDPVASRVPVQKDDWMRAFPHIAHFLSRIEDSFRYDQYQYIRLEKWSVGRIAVIGDAAHAMPPTLGMGANSAFMAALSLAEHVSRRGADDVAASLEEWQQNDRPIIDNIQKTACGRIEGTAAWSYQEGKGWSDTGHFGSYLATGVKDGEIGALR
jgi:2-methyl-3-hydroxypyridine 5-carboxylic acid dioxygenase